MKHIRGANAELVQKRRIETWKHLNMNTDDGSLQTRVLSWQKQYIDLRNIMK